MDVLRLERVGYRYPDGRAALEDLNISIRAGDRVALVGPNGAGKSTLLHLMAGLYLPSTGKLSIMGVEVTRRSAEAARRHVGLLFQDPDDQIFMPSVWEDVAFGPMNYGLGESEVKQRVQEAMHMTGIEGFEERVPHRLSLGEKKRVAMAGLLAMSPDILLLDEPTANLDPQGRRDFVDVLDRRKETIVIATHDLAVAFHLADKVLVLKRSVLYDGGFAGLVQNEAVLQEARLELPSFSRLMQSWAKETGKSFRPPLTVQEALEVLRNNYCCRGDGH
ncbi:MAG: energy-coupling factor ABC transporter ATP-binding protein [Methanomassiliicoccales archaeon]|nr:energy-coupling factor ABC transporter ATP-binding protein [Methanomassiliicoccales archaeon]